LPVAPCRRACPPVRGDMAPPTPASQGFHSPGMQSHPATAIC
jgi:hypothetical protein